MRKTKQYWQQKIRSLREELLRLDTMAAESRVAVELDQSKVGRLSRMDALQGQAMQSAVASRRARDLKLIDHALSLIDQEEFGYCAVCGDEIADARLEINPLVATCIECAK